MSALRGEALMFLYVCKSEPRNYSRRPIMFGKAITFDLQQSHWDSVVSQPDKTNSSGFPSSVSVQDPSLGAINHLKSSRDP